MVGEDHMAKLVKRRTVGQGFVLVQQKVTDTAQDLLELKNVKTRNAQIHFLERSGNVVVKNQ